VADSWQPRLELTHDVEQHGVVASAFLDRALQAGLKELRNDGWATSVRSLELLGEPLLRMSSEAGESALYERDGSLLQVQLWSSHLGVSVVVLWHGQAGTGKTFALRALAWEWREWCQFHYIVDPDSFFGEHADYLISVLLQPAVPMMLGQGGISSFVAFTGDFDDPEGEEESEKPWRLLVLEDTGELLSADARERAGQGLSRFLNVVDGLIGQGLRVLVLVTTNEEIRKLHPAVARPGRCAANVEFTSLSRDEAVRWLAEHELEADATGPRTIASLYAQLEGRDPEETVLVGFGE
jgi:hypothetical protein